MKDDALYGLMKAAVAALQEDYQDIQALDESMARDRKFSDYGFDILSFSEFARDLEVRCDGRRLDLEPFLVPETFADTTIGKVFDRIRAKIGPAPAANPMVVYVDDEEQNVFIFKRKFGKDFNLKTFNDPREALTFITSTPEVRLVVTDEVMPGLRGNQLCDEVHNVRPNIRFVLITGNPENDDNLMYRSLRKNRFYEFFQKPVDFDGKREEYLALMRGLMSGSE